MVKKCQVISQNTSGNFHFEQYTLTLWINNRPMCHVVVAVILRQSHKDRDPFWEKLLTLLTTLLTWSLSEVAIIAANRDSVDVLPHSTHLCYVIVPWFHFVLVRSLDNFLKKKFIPTLGSSVFSSFDLAPQFLYTTFLRSNFSLLRFLTQENVCVCRECCVPIKF